MTAVLSVFSARAGCAKRAGRLSPATAKASMPRRPMGRVVGVMVFFSMALVWFRLPRPAAAFISLLIILCVIQRCALHGPRKYFAPAARLGGIGGGNGKGAGSKPASAEGFITQKRQEAP